METLKATINTTYAAVISATTALARFLRTQNPGYILAAVLLILLTAELGLRTIESSLSGNVRHITEFKTQFADLRSTTPEPETKTLVAVGNSLVNNALNAPMLAELTRAHVPADVQVIKATPDATFGWDWWCLIRNQITNHHKHVGEHLLLGFAWDHLTDQRPPNASRMGAFFCEPADFAPLIQLGMTDHSKLAEFWVGRFSRLYAHRETIRSRLLDAFVPEYREYTRALNAAGQETTPQRHHPDYTYNLLSSKLSLLAASQINVTIIAMPTVTPYEVDANLIKTIIDNGAQFIDLRRLPVNEADHYLDPIHLNDQGAEIFTKYLAEALH
ncbi:hypothetical protein [Thioalkalivibrio sulfidiphilus]|uniref:hypothetical protein n=1 Tax=Thioalkalivibrio sulfidiphilus TaxID=1033854 RepID=UPI00036EAAF5|nr:hypothetical protein [Thioalkalivibrio sulfidiphilus]